MFRKISAEIHDNISLTLCLSSALIRKAISELSDLSKSLSAHSVGKFGLARALEELVSDIAKTQLFALEYDITGTVRAAGKETELILFRMMQECFRNIIRHARARNVKLLLSYHATTLGIEVTDDGAGFDTETVHAINGSGIINLRRRAQLINASLEINSFPGKGTSVKIRVPVNEKPNQNAHRNPSD